MNRGAGLVGLLYLPVVSVNSSFTPLSPGVVGRDLSSLTGIANM